eukprot:1977886-Alexandrium_andersonii.AAC.1
MSASLVGSEMCIRDSPLGLPPLLPLLATARLTLVSLWVSLLGGPRARPVSYTHLTLPTICSV